MSLNREMREDARWEDWVILEALREFAIFVVG